jgi:hypothetical protein
MAQFEHQFLSEGHRLWPTTQDYSMDAPEDEKSACIRALSNREWKGEIVRFADLA